MSVSCAHVLLLYTLCTALELHNPPPPTKKLTLQNSFKEIHVVHSVWLI